jgi:tetratricopeptide (TPR) repeat protein
MKLRSLIALIAICIAALPLAARAGADSDWAQIEAMENGSPAAKWATRDQAQAGAIDYLGKQEQALQDFIVAYPKDPRVADAKMRMAHLLATLGDLEQDPNGRERANTILDQLERDPAMNDRRADVEFARVSLFMQRVDAASANRGALLDKAQAFAKEFPDDRRVAALLAEVASAFDEDDPHTALELLEEAKPKAQTPELQARIADDLKRLAMLNRPLEMQWTAVNGTGVNLDQMRGKVVMIFFFASWSAPSMLELDWVKQLAAGSDSIQALGICLDNDPIAASAMLTERGVRWPIYCDGAGWRGPLVRKLGINSLPALWIVDRDGVLRALDAKDDAPALLEKYTGVTPAWEGISGDSNDMNGSGDSGDSDGSGQ